MRLSDLQNKTVINVIDGKNIGNIIDLEINEEGIAVGLVVEKYKFLISSFILPLGMLSNPLNFNVRFIKFPNLLLTSLCIAL